MTLRHIHDTPRPANGLALAHDGLQLKAIDPNGRVYRVRPERGTPVHAVAAGSTLDPSGADNTVTLTSQSVGLEGNSLRAAMTIPTAATISVTKTGDVVSIAAGSKHRMVVAGTLVPDATGELVYAGLNDTYPTYPEFSVDGTQDVPETGNFVRLTPVVSGESTFWTLAFYTDGSFIGQWVSSDSGNFPNGLTYVADDTETGTPTVTASAPTAAQVVAAVNSAGLDITASGTGTGTVAAVTTTAFTGGRYATLGSAGDQLFDDTNRYLASTDIHATSTTGWKTTAI